MNDAEYQITYLFGAGASANALPTVDRIPNSLNLFFNEIKENPTFQLRDDEFFNGITDESKAQLQREFYETIKWMENETSRHASIDTLAKKLYITEEGPNFRKLKAVLTCFFVYEQFKKPVDPRYDSLFASIIKTTSIHETPLPSNLKILSWNYDFQFEKAYSAYSLSQSLYDNQIKLNIQPEPTFNVKKLNQNNISNQNSFSIFKLNGTTSFCNEDGIGRIEPIISDFNTKIDVSFIDRLINAYASFTRVPQQIRPLLNFAWEDDKIISGVIENAVASTKETDILVVIGYSFPYFNRDIDRKIIRAMKKLNKVYFQAPEEESAKNIDRFRSIIKDVKSLNQEPISDVKQFFLPPEL